MTLSNKRSEIAVGKEKKGFIVKELFNTIEYIIAFNT